MTILERALHLLQAPDCSKISWVNTGAVGAISSPAIDNFTCAVHYTAASSGTYSEILTYDGQGVNGMPGAELSIAPSSGSADFQNTLVKSCYQGSTYAGNGWLRDVCKRSNA